MNTFIVTTGAKVAGYKVAEYLGLACGFVVCASNIAQGLVGGLKQFIGGNISEYAEVCESARADAYRLMVQHAQEMQADAVIGMRYDATEFMQGATEVLAYGTAVRVRRV